MKSITEIDVKELKNVVKELNDSGLIKKKIKIVGAKTEQVLTNFSEAIEALPEDIDIPASIATFYNDLYADEIDEVVNEDVEDVEDVVDDESDEEVADDESDEEVVDDESDGEVVDDESDGEVADEDDDESDEDVVDDESEDVEDVEDVPPPVVEKKEKAAKKESKPPKKDLVIKEEKKPKLFAVKRAVINSKLSLKDKVKNILNFNGGKYKQTAYFSLDCETIRILEGNIGLYPSEIIIEMKQNKKIVKKIEKYSDVILIREINKIKSAYSYIVGAIKEEKVGSKLHYIMQNLVEGKEIGAEIAHASTVKIARRALLAYMDVIGIDYSTLNDVRKELVVASSKTEKTPKAEKIENKPVEVKEEKKAPKVDKKSSKK